VTGVGKTVRTVIRPGRTGDFDRLKAIEIDAFETLREAGGVTGVGDSSSDEELKHYLDAGIMLVAADDEDIAIGYVGAIFASDWLHISEIDIARDWQRKGIGRALMQAMLDEGRARNLAGATLTTDRIAPFNAPFYESIGFRILDNEELPRRLRGILAREHAAGLDPARRVAMILTFE
jgi:GNAT superfamily N-acetyltransferase